MAIRSKHKVGRNEPCPCDSGLKFKHCHSDPLKIAVCERVVQEKMLELIRIEQRKQIIKLQQKDCDECGGSGLDQEIEPCFECQFINEEERSKELYRRKTNENRS